MKLRDLEPRWCVAGDWPKPRHGMGISFLCPVHKNHHLVVMFANPLDGMVGCLDANYLWQRIGETFDDLTLGPSIDASENKADVGDNIGMIQTPCWHGYIKNGLIK